MDQSVEDGVHVGVGFDVLETHETRIVRLMKEIVRRYQGDIESMKK